MRNTISRILREARASAPVIAAASGLVCLPTYAAPGDLDPTFGDIGRLEPFPDLAGPIWSAEPFEDDVILGGGEYENCFFYCFYFPPHASGFAGRLDAEGAPDASFATAALADIQVFDVAVRDDGKAVGVVDPSRASPNGWPSFVSRATARSTRHLGPAASYAWVRARKP